MRKVIFPLEKEAGKNKVKLPDTKDKFKSVEVVGDSIIAMYSGDLPLDGYVEPAVPNETIYVVDKANLSKKETDEILLAIAEKLNIAVEQL